VIALVLCLVLAFLVSEWLDIRKWQRWDAEMQKLSGDEWRAAMEATLKREYKR
jgi:hypothetical protein